MEKELVRFGQEYSFSITQADEWLCEGLWVFLRKREKVFFFEWNDSWQSDHFTEPRKVKNA